MRKAGEAKSWDWQQSGVEEMNCFLCHTPDAQQSGSPCRHCKRGRFQWANTATLLGSGIGRAGAETAYRWNPAAFEANGEIKQT